MKKMFKKAAVAGLCLLAAGCSRKTEDLDGEAIVWLQKNDTAAVADAIGVIQEARSEQEKAAAESRAAASSEALAIEESKKAAEESRIEESKRALESSLEESRSIENSIAESISAFESESVSREQYEASSIAESLYLEAVARSEAEAAESASLMQESILQSIAESSSVAAVESSLAESRSVEESVAASVSEEESIRESLIQESIMQESARLESIRQSIADEESGAVETAGEYLTQLCAGTNLIPYGVNTIKDSDLYIMHELFKKSVVIGDSRAEGAVWVLAGSEVFYSRGSHAASPEMHTKALEAASMYPEKALFWLGLNDMGIHGANVDVFIRDYKALINDFLSVDPGCIIYVQNMTPPGSLGIEKYPGAAYSDMYSEAVKKMCDECGWNYFDANSYFDMSFYAADGLHYDKKYYMYWVQDAAVRMGLWGDKEKWAQLD